MLPELFQDDEKAISPTSATSSGRTPLTRTPSKPTKGRPGQTAKEHKKTVGHQVSSGSCRCGAAPLRAQLGPQVFFCQPPRWGPQVARGWSARSENVELCPFMLPYFSSHIIDPWLQKLCPKSFFLHFNSSSAYLHKPLLPLFWSLAVSSLELYNCFSPGTLPPHFWCLVRSGVGGWGRPGKHDTQALCPNKGSGLGRGLSASQFVCPEETRSWAWYGPTALSLIPCPEREPSLAVLSDSFPHFLSFFEVICYFFQYWSARFPLYTIKWR